MGVRRERVVLELEDQFTRDMIASASATALLRRELKALSGTAVETDRETARVQKSIKGAGDEIDRTSDKARRGAADIDRYSGRLRLLTDAAITIGPALIPIGAAGIPAIMALTAGLGGAAAALGVTVLAVHGLGDGLAALNEYQLAPTEANLAKLREEFDKIGPSGERMIRLIDQLEPELRGLQEAARAGGLPGFEAAIAALLPLLPQLRVLVFNVATALGTLTAEAAGALSGEGMAGFFDYISTTGGPLLISFGRTIGNVVAGLGSLIVAFGPLTGSFVGGMEEMSRAFADWAAGLSQTQGFRDFVDYVQRTGPQVIAMLGSIATAFVAILTAAAPVGEAVLPALTALAKVLALIAASPIGPPLFTAAAAMLAVNRATLIAEATMKRFSSTSATAARSAAMVGAGLNFAVILAGIWAVDAALDKVFGDRSIDIANLGRNLEALASGHVVDNLSALGDDLKTLNRSTSEWGEKWVDSFVPGNLTDWDEARDRIAAIDDALAQMVESGNAEQAASAFAQIQEQVGAAGGNTAETAKWFEQYNLALENTAPSAEEAAAAQRRLTEANDSAARVTAITRSEVEGLNQAMEEQVSAALGAYDAVTRYHQALQEAQKRAKNTEAGLDASTAAGRKNRDLMSQLAASWNSQGDAIRNNMAKWREARSNFIETAVAMGAPIDQAEKLADRLLAIPKQRQIDIKLYGSEEAADRIEAIRRAITSVPTEWRTRFYVTQVNALNKQTAGGADGDPTTPYDGGGFTGRGPRKKVAGVVHAGEVVLPQHVVRRDKSHLMARYGYLPNMSALPGFADGGLAGVGTAAVASSEWYGINLTQREYARALQASERGLKAELKMRERLLDRELQRAEKATDAARDHRDAVIDDIKSIRQSIADRFKSDLFGQQGPGFQAPTAGLPDNFDELSVEEQRAAIRKRNQEQADLDQLYAQINAFHTQSPVDILRADLARQDEARKLYRQLEAAGLHGAALTYAQENASNEELAALLADPQMLRQYQRLYGQREQGARDLGQTAALQRMGSALRDANKVLADQLAIERDLRQELKDVNTKLEEIRKEAKENSDDNAKKTTNGLNAAGAAASRRGGGLL